MNQLTFDEALIKVGASNWYQYRAFLIFGMQWFIGNWILISPIYLNQNPMIDCQGNQTCSEVCSNINQMSKDMNSECKSFVCENRQYINGESLSNAFGKVIQCDQEYLTTVFQSMTYLGSTIGFFVFSYIGDNYGRKPALQLSWGLATLGLLLQACSINYYMIVIGLFATGFGLNPAITLHYSLFNEHTIGHFRDIQNAGVQICYGLGEMVLVLIAYYFQKWRELVIWMTIPVFILNFANFFLFESPKFQYSKSKSKGVKVLNQIARVNGKEPINIDSIQDNELGKFNKQKTYSGLDLFKYNSLRWIFMGGFQIFFSIQVVYYGIGFATDSLGLNLYINNLIISSFEVAAYCISDYFIVKIKRRLWTSIVFIMVGAISGAYYIIPNNQTWQVIQILLLGVILFFNKNTIQFMRFSICFVWALAYTYVSELFPTVVRSTALGLISSGGTLGSVTSPIIKNLIASPQLVMVVLGTFAILGGLVVIPMRETLNKPLQDEITEEMRKKSMVADANVNLLISESDITQSQNYKLQ